MYTMEKESYRGCTARVVVDEYSNMNPRDDESNLSVLVFSPNRRYAMPNEVDFDFDAYDADVEDGGARAGESGAQWCVRKLQEDHGALYVVPVYMFEHSGVAYRVGDGGNPFRDPWDSGQVGYAIVTPESAADIGTPPELFAEVVASEVERYGAWCNGECYGWIAEAGDGEQIDSCWGYIGSDEWDYMIEEARHAIDWHLDALDEKANAIAADAMAELLRAHA